MADATGNGAVKARCVGDVAIICAGDYLNKLSGERVERECKRQLEAGCRALVLNFRDTDAVNHLRVAEIQNQRPATRFQPALAFALDALSAQLVQIVARTNDGHISDTTRLDHTTPCRLRHSHLRPLTRPSLAQSYASRVPFVITVSSIHLTDGDTA